MDLHHNFGARIANVDYDGKKVYDAYLAEMPHNKDEDLEFVKKHAPMMIAGAEAVADFITALKNGSLQLES